MDANIYRISKVMVDEIKMFLKDPIHTNDYIMNLWVLMVLEV